MAGGDSQAALRAIAVIEIIEMSLKRCFMFCSLAMRFECID
jgi:hypothetical protein